MGRVAVFTNLSVDGVMQAPGRADEGRLGSGRRLFADAGAFTALRLVESKATANGVVIATYQPT